jgi:hypothetical protein
MTPMRTALAAAFVAAMAASCAPHVPYALSSADQTRFGGLVLRTPPQKNGAPLIFGLDDCTLYKAQTEHQDITGWRITLRSDWGGSYPKFFTACTAQSIKYAGGYVIVHFCAQAFGAGGGCADGGDYRSRDGEHHWQYADVSDHWDPLPS